MRRDRETGLFVPFSNNQHDVQVATPSPVSRTRGGISRNGAYKQKRPESKSIGDWCSAFVVSAEANRQSGSGTIMPGS